MNLDDESMLARWRLVLGKDAEAAGLCLGGSEGDTKRVDDLVGFLSEEGDGSDETNPAKKRGGGREGTNLTIPEWIDGVSELFPRAAKEVLERELVQRRGIDQLLNQPELLEKIEPNMELVKTILTHRDLLSPKTRVLARKIINKVVDELKKTIRLQVEPAITGAIRRDRHSPRRVYRNLDIRTTIRRNLQHYDTENERLLVDRVFYYAAERNKRPWHIIVAVDQSGSMLGSAIFSTIMASIFYELPSVRTSLFLFDTTIVDLTDQVGQPVDVLLKIQLGGGTDIHRAMTYANQLAREPARTIVVLITDFYEGGDARNLFRQTGEMAAAGIRLVGVAALGYDARPEYHKPTAKQMRKKGMDILCCTPEKLAECMAQIIQGRS